MNILVLDTSTPACSVALLLSDRVIGRDCIAPRRHTALLLGMVDEMVEEAGIQLADLDLIAVGLGPGSFIGVRFAVSIAKSLAYSLQLPCVGFSTLHLLAQTAYLKRGFEDVVVGWDARMEQVYVGRYGLQADGLMMSVSSDALVSPGECDLKGRHAVGNGWEVYRADFQAGYLDGFSVTDVSLYPSASAAQAWQFLKDSSCWVSAEDLLPLYFRGAVTS